MSASKVIVETARAGRADVPSGTPAWVTPELLKKTQEIWGKKSGIPISSDEALGILLRVSALLDVLHTETNNEQAIRRMGTRVIGPAEEGRVQP